MFFIPLNMKAKNDNDLSIYFSCAVMLSKHVTNHLVLSGIMCGELMYCYILALH